MFIIIITIDFDYLKDKKSKLQSLITKYKNEINSYNNNNNNNNINIYNTNNNNNIDYHSKIKSLQTEITNYNNIITKCIKDIQTLTNDILSLKLKLTEYSSLIPHKNNHSKKPNRNNSSHK
jgi:chromosome segregation ATPase